MSANGADDLQNYDSKLEISRIWSDQVPDMQFNSLPANAASNTGAGEYGSQLGLIVMGARGDDKGYVKCKIKLDPDNPWLRSNIVLRLVNSAGGGEVLAEPSWNDARDTASFWTLGVGGEVFGIKVNLDGDIENIRYDGYSSLKIAWVDRSDGRKLVLECTHASASPMLIEKSTDLKSWDTLGTNQLNGSVSYVDLDTLMSQQTRCYFRVKQ